MRYGVMAPWSMLVLAPAIYAQELPEVVCSNLQVVAGQSVPLQCSLHSLHADTYTFQWESADARHLRLLSSRVVRRPVFTAPIEVGSPFRVSFVLVVSTAKGRPLARAPVQVEVIPRQVGPSLGFVPLPPVSHCPSVLHLYEGERQTLACHATDPVSSTGTSLRYRWDGPLPVVPVDVLNPTVEAPPVPPGVESQSFPMRLTITSQHSQLTAHAQVTIVVRARAPSLDCPTSLEVTSGASIVLACHGSAPLQEEATYQWSGLWGTSTAPLSATDILAPTFRSPTDAQETVFHYVVRMQSSRQSTRHRVTVHVRDAASPLEKDPLCGPLTLVERERSPLPCHLPSGHRLRWRGPVGPWAPQIVEGMLVAPPVAADTVFTYTVKSCPADGGPCTREMPWHVTVQRQKPPAVSCKASYDTYAGEADLLMQCAVSGGTDYTFEWTGTDVDRLSATDILSPTFDVPAEVSEEQEYHIALAVTDVYIGTTSTDVRIRVRKRGQVALDCSRLEYFVYAGSADFPLQPQCSLSGAPDLGADYYHRWYASSSARDAARLTDTRVRHPVFTVPDTLAAPYVYEYLYVAGARHADPASVEVRVTVAPFPTAFEMATTTTALQFGEQAAGQEVTLDPLTGNVSAKVRGSHSVGRMILASEQAVEAALELSGGQLYPEEGGDILPLVPEWSVSASCLSPATEALTSNYAVVDLQGEEEGCRIVHIGGTLDLSQVAPGRYTGNLDLILRAGEVQETFLMPVYVTVVPPRRAITTGPQGTYVGPDGVGQVSEVQQVRIHPLSTLLSPEVPYGTFTLSNPSVVTQEVSVQSVFGYTEAREDRMGETLVLAPTDSVGDLGAALLVYPKVLTLGPGETKYVHYALRDDIVMPEIAHATLLEFSSRPRRYVRADRLPVPGDSARVANMRLRIQSTYVPAQGARQVSVTRLPDAADLFLFEAIGGPFSGEVVATDANGQELGRRSLLLLTTRILSWPLAPLPEGDVTLHFVTSSGIAPLSVILPR